MGAASLQRKFANQQMKKVMGGDLVSDRETRQMKEQAQNMAEAGLQAQQAALARSQQAMAGGSPVAQGAMAQAQGAMAKTAGDAAVKASGQAQDLAAALSEQRKGQALAQAQEMYNRNMRALDFGMKAVESAGQIAALIGGGPVGAAMAGAMSGGGQSQRAGNQLIKSGVEATDEQIDQVINFQ